MQHFLVGEHTYFQQTVMGSQTPPTLIFKVSVCVPPASTEHLLLDCRNLNRIWFLCLGKHNLNSGGREIKIAHLL